MAETLKYFSEHRSPLTGYFFNFASLILGAKIIRQEALSDDTDIYYGNNDVKAKLIIRENPIDIVWDELIKGKVTHSNHGRIINFDIVNSVVNFLTDKVNQNLTPDSYDSHQRLKYEYSYQAQMGIGAIPAVNIYIKFFKELLKKYTFYKEISLFPRNKKCVIGLSHDVDKPFSYQILRNYRFNNIWSPKEKTFHLIRYLHNRRKYLFDTKNKCICDFEKIIEIEKNFGFVSTFLFASNNGYTKWGSVNDVFYDIIWNEFCKVFDKIRSNGFFIGLHASYNAYASSDRFEYEKEKLEKISGGNVIGVRHHFWHIGRNEEDTLLKHEKSGFKYDSSIAFNNHIGFKRNTALPYYPFSFKECRKINCLQLPVFCMDGNLINQIRNINEALKTISKFIETIMDNQGIGIIDWHAECSLPKRNSYFKWGETYNILLKELSQYDCIWVTSLENIYTHIKKRENEIYGEV